jgi:hypothetical protein
VERVQFVKDRVRFARRVNESHQGARRLGGDDPEALALYLIQDGARRLAERRYPNPEDQQKFLARVRDFFNASPEREGLIARAVERLNASKTAQKTVDAGRSHAEEPNRSRKREGFTRE